MITRLYVLFFGLLLALLVGVGIGAFYHAPKPPTYPVMLEKSSPTPDTVEDMRTRQQYEQDSKQYQTSRNTYDRNVSLVALLAAIILVTLGLTALKAMPVINDALLLGGTFTLIYSIMRGFGAGDDTFRFLVVLVSLAVAVVLGYLKLIKPMEAKTTPKRR